MTYSSSQKKEASATYMLAGATQLRVYEGKKVRISGVLDSPHVIVVRTIDAVD